MGIVGGESDGSAGGVVERAAVDGEGSCANSCGVVKGQRAGIEDRAGGIRVGRAESEGAIAALCDDSLSNVSAKSVCHCHCAVGDIERRTIRDIQIGTAPGIVAREVVRPYASQVSTASDRGVGHIKSTQPTPLGPAHVQNAAVGESQGCHRVEIVMESDG